MAQAGCGAAITLTKSIVSWEAKHVCKYIAKKGLAGKGFSNTMLHRASNCN